MLWRTIPEFPNYEIRGKKVRSKKKGCVLKTYLEGKTLFVRLFSNKKRYVRSIDNLRAQALMHDVKFYPIPSTDGLYEISEKGIVRNAENKHVRKQQNGQIILNINGRYVTRSILSLRAEVFGSKDVRRCRMPVTLAKGNQIHVLPNKTRAAEFIAAKTFYSPVTCYPCLIKRQREIFGWRVTYFEDDTRTAQFLRAGDGK